MRHQFDEEKKAVNDCGNGRVVLFTGGRKVTATENVQTGEDTYEQREVTKYEYDYTELSGVEQPVTDVSVLKAVRKLAAERIEDYDTSESVNQFTLSRDGRQVNYWLPAGKRDQLTRAVTSWKEAGNATYKLDLREYGISVDVDCDKLLTLLAELENYAVECYNTTSAHLNAVESMTDIEALLSYDYAADYPSALTFEI